LSVMLALVLIGVYAAQAPGGIKQIHRISS